MANTEEKTLRTFIREVLTGFANKSAGKDGVAGNMFMSDNSDQVGVRPDAHQSVLDDEEEAEDMDLQDKKHAACCLILSDDGNGTVLAVSRRDDPTAFGLPGGKVDPGETPMQAAARELQEETGLTAVDLHKVFERQDGDGFVTHTYACKVEGQINTDESGAVKWVTPDILFAGPFGAYNRTLWQKLNLPTGKSGKAR